jgi:hypothetical protein
MNPLINSSPLADLRARVVEFAGLPDDDRSRPDDENTVDVGAFRHGGGVL